MRLPKNSPNLECSIRTCQRSTTLLVSHLRSQLLQAESQFWFVALWFSSLNWGFIYGVSMNEIDIWYVMLATSSCSWTRLVFCLWLKTNPDSPVRKCTPAWIRPASLCLRSTTKGPRYPNHPAPSPQENPLGKTLWLLVFSPHCDFQSVGYFPRAGFI